jgi:hypothetical protein
MALDHDDAVGRPGECVPVMAEIGIIGGRAGAP